MSVVLECLSGYLLNHEKVITLSCGAQPFECHPCIFNTFEPYIKGVSNSTTSSQDSGKKKKRKRKHSFNTGEINALEHHEKIREKIINGLEVLRRITLWNKYFSSCNLQNQKETSSFLQAALDCSEILSVINKTHTTNNIPLFPVDHVKYEITSIVNRMVYNNNEISMMLSVSGAKYIIPAQSQFILSDIAYLTNLTKTLDFTYDFIVIDPPWENKSVKRGSKYSSLPLWEIKKLPISDLASDKAYVAVWVTNKQKYRKFVLEELFPSWSCAFVGEWHWIKLTKSGQLIHDMESNHKKPYEPLLIGQFTHNGTGQLEYVKKLEVCSKCHDEFDRKLERNIEITIPEHQIFCSVPCSLHSRKPPLNDIFLKYLPGDAKCIELFARNLIPNWSSWGNEVLKYQHLDYFQRKITL